MINIQDNTSNINTIEQLTHTHNNTINNIISQLTTITNHINDLQQQQTKFMVTNCYIIYREDVKLEKKTDLNGFDVD